MEYPGNGREEKIQKEASPERKVEKVISGEVQRRKKPLGKRITETFIQGEGRTVWSFVAYEVLVPAAKDMVADAFSQGVEKMLFGEARSTSRRGHRPSGSGGYMPYHRYGSSSGPTRRDEPRNVSRRARANHDFDEIILDTRAEAEEVVDRLFDLISRYESATVADLYELVGVTSNYPDDKWGWLDIRGATVTRVRNGYLLDLPRPEPLN